MKLLKKQLLSRFFNKVLIWSIFFYIYNAGTPTSVN